MLAVASLMCGRFAVDERDFLLAAPAPQVAKVLREIPDDQWITAQWRIWTADERVRPYLARAVLDEQPVPRRLKAAFRFELADVRVEVSDKGEVKAVAKNSPFRGRLAAKDVLKAVNGTPVTTADEVRRALRRAVVLGCAVVGYERNAERRSKLVPVTNVAGEK